MYYIYINLNLNYNNYQENFKYIYKIINNS